MSLRRQTAQHRPLRTVLALAVMIAAVASAVLLSAASSAAPEDVDQRVEAILSRMTLEQKIDMLGGLDEMNIRAYRDLGVPQLKMADGPVGVRNYGPATAMAGGIALAASWDPALAEQVGKQIGRDARAKGVNFMLGPGVNIYRAPMNGRNFEYLGEDPYLAGRMVVGYIRGMQSEGVSATVKHFMGNNSEFDRHNTDSIIDERTMREIYLPAFEAAVKLGHVGSVMSSYNLTNGIHMSQNPYLIIDVLKKEWGFTGIFMSDWGATYDGVAAANAGLDLEMPSGLFMNRANLLPAIQQGRVSVATIDDKIRRILRTAIQFGWFDREQLDLAIPRYNREGDQTALQAAREGIVLLKNDGGLLPLDKHKIKTVLVIGPDAYPAVSVGGGSAQVVPFAPISFLQGISDYVGGDAKVLYSPGIRTLSEAAASTWYSTAASGGTAGLKAEYFANEELQGAPFLSRTEDEVNYGAPTTAQLPVQSLSARWSGYYVPAAAGDYDLFVSTTGEDGGYYRIYVDDKLILDDWKDSRELLGSARLSLDAGAHKIVLEQHGHSRWRGGRFEMGIVRSDAWVLPDAKKLAANADAVIVAAGFDTYTESEGADRTFHLPPGQDGLINEMLSANKNTIVLVTSGGGVDMSKWIEHAPAVLEAWYPGQEGGRAAADVLFGAVDPSGRLPITIEKRREDNPVHDSYYPAAGTNRVVYKEGVFVGYRGYEHNNTAPLFPFGFGLSYTNFRYGNLAIKPAERASRGDTLSAPLYQISFDVTNAGARKGADVAQVYVAEAHPAVARPAKELKGFARLDLKPGETKTATVTLDGRAFSYYDAGAKQWHADAGEYQILVGRSSQEIVLRGSLTLPATDSGAGNKGGF
jgi:beta-glucosidase